LALDRGLAAALVDLAPTNGWMRAQLEEHRDWRESVWSTPDVWNDIPQRVNEVLTRINYQRVPGWAGLEGRFQLESTSARPTSEPRLPTATLMVTRPGTIDRVLLRPEWNDDLDWNDVVAAYERAERAASTQPWLARWKRENQGRIGVFFPLGIDQLVRYASVAAEAWEETQIGGTPEIALLFSFQSSLPDGRVMNVGCGQGVLSAEGTLLILQSNSTRGPLASDGLLNSGIDLTQRYAVVRPGAAPEIRTRQN